MALIKCRECGNDVSTAAKACQKCGAKPKRKTGTTGWLFLAIGGAFVYWMLSGASSPSKPTVSHSESYEALAKPVPNSDEVNKQIAIDGINVKKSSWHKGGFENIMMVGATFENAGKNAVKDLVLQCSAYASSGTKLSSHTKVIYELIPAGKSRSVKDFSMGFIDKQTSEIECRITDLKFECSSARPCRF